MHFNCPTSAILAESLLASLNLVEFFSNVFGFLHIIVLPSLRTLVLNSLSWDNAVRSFPGVLCGSWVSL